MPHVFVSMAGKIERPTYVPSQTYASGVYSNGPVWATDAAAKLGVPLAPSLAPGGGTNYAFGGAIVGADCSTYAYWDGIHPTAAAHEIIADAFVLAAVPEPSTWVMMFVGFACVGFVAYRRHQRQQPPATLSAA